MLASSPGDPSWTGIASTAGGEDGTGDESRWISELGSLMVSSTACQLDWVGCCESSGHVEKLYDRGDDGSGGGLDDGVGIVEVGRKRRETMLRMDAKNRDEAVGSCNLDARSDA